MSRRNPFLFIRVQKYVKLFLNIKQVFFFFSYNYLFTTNHEELIRKDKTKTSKYKNSELKKKNSTYKSYQWNLCRQGLIKHKHE